MELSGTLTATDLVVAQWVDIKPRPAFAIVGIALLATGIWAIWYSFSVPSLRGNGWLLLGSLGLMAALAVRIRYKAIRIYRQRRAMQRSIRLEPTDTGLFSKSETGHGITPWSDFLKWKEGNGLFLLYVSDDMFHIVPKRFFNSEDDISEFRKILTTNVSQRSRPTTRLSI